MPTGKSGVSGATLLLFDFMMVVFSPLFMGYVLVGRKGKRVGIAPLFIDKFPPLTFWWKSLFLIDR